MTHEQAMRQRTSPDCRDPNPHCTAALIDPNAYFADDVNWVAYSCPACGICIATVEGREHWWNSVVSPSPTRAMPLTPPRTTRHVVLATRPDRRTPMSETQPTLTGMPPEDVPEDVPYCRHRLSANPHEDSTTYDLGAGVVLIVPAAASAHYADRIDWLVRWARKVFS